MGTGRPVAAVRPRRMRKVVFSLTTVAPLAFGGQFCRAHLDDRECQVGIAALTTMHLLTHGTGSTFHNLYQGITTGHI